MSSKAIFLTSSGLKNIIEKGNEFSFIFGERIIKMNNINAEFLSPVVSHIHHADPTIENIQYEYPKSISNFPQFEELISDDIVTILKKVACGEMININKEQSKKLRLISIFLNNEELFNTVFKPFANMSNKKQEISDNIKYFELSEYLNNDIINVIDYLASEFESISQEDLLQLSIDNLLKIIKNEHLIINNYNQYIGTILEIIKNHESDNIFNEFYEFFDFKKMNDVNFIKVLNYINPNCITIPLWRKLINRISNKEYLYDGKKEHQLEGIIYNLSKEFGGNVHDQGVVFVKASKESNSVNLAKNVVDYNNKEKDENRMRTENEEGSWIEFDFAERRIYPTHYTIRSINWGQNDKHLQSWVIEGSCNKNKGWKIINSQNNVDTLNGKGIVHTFEIDNNSNKIEFYRYLRLRQTGPNKQNNNILTISALEYFGKVKVHI